MVPPSYVNVGEHNPPVIVYLVGALEHFLFSIIYGMSSFPLTFIFFQDG